MNDLDEFETRIAQLDMGRLTGRVYSGAREETYGRVEAVCATVAALIAMLKSNDLNMIEDEELLSDDDDE